MTRTLGQHAVVERGDNGTSEAVTTVEADTVASRTTVNLDLAGVRLEPSHIQSPRTISLSQVGELTPWMDPQS